LEAEKTEMLANEKAEEERHAEEMEELKADKEMLSTEVCVLKQEVIDFRSRVDALVEENATLKQHEQTLNESLDTMEDRLEVCEQKVRELEDLLEERDELLDERIREIDQLKSELSEINSDNSSLRSRLRELRDDRDRWKADNEKGIKIINKLYKEQKERRLRDEYMAANGGDASGADRIKQLETDLEDRKHTIDTLNETNAQLREQMEKLMTECSNAKKDVQQWCEKYEKKEKMLGDLLKMRHSTSPTAVGTPLTTPLTQNFAQLSQTAAPITYPRVLGWSTMTGQLTTPLRNSPYSRASPLGMINRENIPPTTTVTSPTLSQIAPTQPNLS
uniref:NUDE_C domain-containing protein n=1 Tax=Anisakis simplex TaxID=6269 RepID=A0A0M3J0T0_ANISI